VGARIVIRVDGSHQVGMGHVYRMVNLAETLTEAGVESLTFCGRADEQVGTWLQKRKFKVEILPYDGEVIAQLAACLRACGANLLINDILDTDIEYMAAVRSVDCAIVNFDDGGPGRHLADCRINALPSKILPQEQGNHIYQGPDYLLLGGEFSPTTARRIRGESLTSLLITLGGSDTYGNTLAVVAALQSLESLPPAHIITGPAFRHHDELHTLLAGDKRFAVHASVPSMAECMQQHDLAILGGGIMLFEAATCALPTLSIASEDFERLNIQWAEDRGITRFAAGGQPASADVIGAAARSLLENAEERRIMSELGPQVVDGRGGQRIAQIIKGLYN
jgi:spore coat polysaccharide biosynthesis predicted glycosyltransferase SpsG